MSYFLRSPLFLLMALALATGANAQAKPKAQCLAAKDMKAEQLFGLWEARFTNPPAGVPARAAMTLRRHAEFADSLAGVVSRKLKPLAASSNTPAPSGMAATAALAGDLDEGFLLLDESSDRIRITGTWNGEMVPGSCGKVFQGEWRDTSGNLPEDAPAVPFTLTKLP